SRFTPRVQGVSRDTAFQNAGVAGTARGGSHPLLETSAVWWRHGLAPGIRGFPVTPGSNTPVARAALDLVRLGAGAKLADFFISARCGLSRWRNPCRSARRRAFLSVRGGAARP